MSFFGDLKDFAGNVPILGDFVGESTTDLSRDQQRRYQQLHDQYMAQLEPLQQARMQALSQTMGLFQPMNDLMQRQYGTGYDFSSLLQNPMEGYSQNIEQNLNNIQGKQMAGALNALGRNSFIDTLVPNAIKTASRELAKPYDLNYDPKSKQWSK